jgi:hypothetical protein
MCNQDQPSWGLLIHRSVWHKTRDCPNWANPSQREKWDKRGLILWDHESKLITRLSGGYALQLLEYLRNTDDWKGSSIVVGEPATEISIDEPEREPKQVLTSQFELNPARTQEVFELLLRNEAALKEISDQEEEERGQALQKCYKIIFGEELWTKLATYYAVKPEEAMELVQELLAKRLGTM